MVWLPDDEKTAKIRLLVLTQYKNVTDSKTDGRTYTDTHRMTAQATLMHSVARRNSASFIGYRFDEAFVSRSLVLIGPATAVYIADECHLLSDSNRRWNLCNHLHDTHLRCLCYCSSGCSNAELFRRCYGSHLY